MRVFLTGATGWIGSAVARELTGHGHSVIAPTRSREDADRIGRLGIEPMVGALDDVDLLRRSASSADAVIHTAMGSATSDPDKPIRDDVRAIEAFGDAFAGTDRPIVVTHGLGALQDGVPFTEAARPGVIPAYPRASEQTAFALADRGLKAMAVRPARSVHGIGERHGFVPQLARVARERGVSAWVGDGCGPWPACHRLDVARVFRLAVERGAGGEAYHAVAEGVRFGLIAEAIGRQLGLPARSIPPEDADDHFGQIAAWVTGRDEVSTTQTRRRLGWEPREVDLLTDIDRPEYFTKADDHEG